MTPTAFAFPVFALIFASACMTSEAQTRPERAPAADGVSTEAIEIPEPIVRQIRSDPEDARRRHIGQLFTFSPDGIVTREHVARYERALEARERAQRLEKLLGYDLDADGQVTTAEIAEGTLEDRRPDRVAIAIAMLKGDVDGNEILTISEMVAVVRADRPNARAIRPDINPLIFDRDLDGKVDPREVSDVIDSIASRVN